MANQPLHDVCARLEELITRQEQAIAHGNHNELCTVIAQKQLIVNQVHRLPRAPQFDARLNERITHLLERDAASVATMKEQLDAIAAELSDLKNASKSQAVYSPPAQSVRRSRLDTLQ